MDEIKKEKASDNDESQVNIIIKTTNLPANSQLTGKSMDIFQRNERASQSTTIRYEHGNDEKALKVDHDIVDYNAYLRVMQENHYSRRLIHLEYVSIFLTALSFVVFAILAYEDDSVSAFAFSVDSFLDVITYIIVIWRFSNIADIESTKKDRKAQIAIGLVFIGSSLGVEYESINNLVLSLKPIPSFLFIIIGIFEAILFSALAILKFLIARKFESNKTIISDGVNSLIAALGALSMTIGMTVYVVHNEVWYLDAIFGFFMGLFVFIYGCKLIIDNTCFHHNK